mmetsp:Transcript_175929/g.564078  ORF Transcript_175929/g.564078 Transcript_175929/m.564078 type:complete len:205 (-) Transcript_175929:1665-2279(-)
MADRGLLQDCEGEADSEGAAHRLREGGVLPRCPPKAGVLAGLNPIGHRSGGLICHMSPVQEQGGHLWVKDLLKRRQHVGPSSNNADASLRSRTLSWDHHVEDHDKNQRGDGARYPCVHGCRVAGRGRTRHHHAKLSKHGDHIAHVHVCVLLGVHDEEYRHGFTHGETRVHGYLVPATAEKLIGKLSQNSTHDQALNPRHIFQNG